MVPCFPLIYSAALNACTPATRLYQSGSAARYARCATSLNFPAERKHPAQSGSPRLWASFPVVVEELPFAPDKPARLPVLRLPVVRLPILEEPPRRLAWR